MREIFKAALKTGIGSMGFLLLGMLAMKIMAVVVGPSGVGLYSLLRQTMDFSNNLGTLGGGTALVQGLASRKGQARDDYLVTTFWIFLIGALSTSIVLLVFAPWIALWVFDRNDGQTTNMVRGLALPVVLLVGSTYLNGVINGFRAIGLLALLQVLGAAAAVLLVYPVSLLVEVGYPLAFIALISAPPAIGVALGTWSAVKAGWLNPLLSNLRISFHSDSLRHFFSLAGTMLVTGLATAGTVLVVRSLLVHYEGFASAGIFAAAWTLSMTYVMVVLTSFGTYYLPTLSGTGDPLDRVVLMQRVMRFATLLSLPLVTSVIVLKPLAIETLYSSEFIPALEIIRWMLIGDYLKIAAYVVAMPVLAYADMKVFFWTELLWSVGFLAFATLALSRFGSIQGLGAGFLLMYAVILAYYLHYARSRHQLPLTRATVGPWLIGLTLVVGASWYTWSDTQVHWVGALLWVGVAASLSWTSVHRSERKEMFHMLLRRKTHHHE